VRSPYDGAEIGRAVEAGSFEAEAAVRAAHLAFAHWRSTPVDERRALLRAIASRVRQHEADLVRLLQLEVGKPQIPAQGEIARLALTFDLAANLEGVDSFEVLDTSFDPRGKDFRVRARRFAIGPLLAIVPYNWPFNLAAHKLAPALIAGNTVVLKGSPLAPLCTTALARIVQEAGCPPGVVDVLDCAAEIAQGIALDPRIRMVSFTGSAQVGWHLKSLLPEKRVVLELGGDATCIVAADADLEWAAKRVAVSAFGYAGQVCISAQHVRVHRSVLDAFRALLVEAAKSTRAGDPLDPEVLCGPLISAEAAERVMQWIEEARSAGARILCGGERIGNVVMPTVLEGAPETCRVMREEVFGPVVTLHSFETWEEVVGQVNASQYGIHCSVFTHDDECVRRVYEHLDVGGVIINEFPTLRFDNMPYGGVKRSGFGREGVQFAYEEMTEWKTLVERIGQ
jgi:acyl-CoA reductase-like NAD-dependent aldehyde dehydrogenase